MGGEDYWAWDIEDKANKAAAHEQTLHKKAYCFQVYIMSVNKISVRKRYSTRTLPNPDSQGSFGVVSISSIGRQERWEKMEAGGGNVRQ